MKRNVVKDHILDLIVFIAQFLFVLIIMFILSCTPSIIENIIDLIYTL